LKILCLVSLVKVLLCAVILSLASFEDWKTREINDTFWFVLGGSGAVLTAIEIAIENFSLDKLVILTLSIAACLALGFGLYYVGFFGGADAKCLWCLGVALPYSPTSNLGLNVLGPQNPIFSISIFNNSILTAALLALGIICFNAIRRVKGPLFSTEENSLWRRGMALMLGYKMKISKVLSKKDFYFPLEEFVVGNGGVKRRFRLLTRCLDDDLYAKLRELVDRGVIKDSDEIWVSPAIPLIVNITVGFFIALFYGDLVLAIAEGLLNFIL